MKKLIILLALNFLISCNKDNDDIKTANATNIDLVAGLHIRNSNDSEIIKLGNPNVWNENQFIIYPNPTAGALSLSSNDRITDVWIIAAKANKTYQNTNFNLILNSNVYSESQIISNSKFQFNNLNSSNVVLNLNDVNSGYYKVFVKINSKLYWENIYVPDDNFQIEDLLNYWN